jgi:predicted GNAT family N-acyltransferase
MQINICDFETFKALIYSVRGVVFEQEQGVSRQLERDGKDKDCIHVLAVDDHCVPVGTGRLQLDGKIGRMAVLHTFRNQKIGSRMLEVLLQTAVINKMDQVYLNAQKTALGFYEKFGFKATGLPFIEADIWHVKMIKRF